MQTRAWKMHRPALGTLARLEGVHAVEPGPMRIGTVGVLIG